MCVRVRYSLCVRASTSATSQQPCQAVMHWTLSYSSAVTRSQAYAIDLTNIIIRTLPGAWVLCLSLTRWKLIFGFGVLIGMVFLDRIGTQFSFISSGPHLVSCSWFRRAYPTYSAFQNWPIFFEPQHSSQKLAIIKRYWGNFRKCMCTPHKYDIGKRTCAWKWLGKIEILFFRENLL